MKQRFPEFIILLLVLLMVQSAYGQKVAYGKMSPLVSEAALAYHSDTWRAGTRQTAERIERMTVFVKISEGEADEILKRYGGKILAQWGDICIASIPRGHLAALSAEQSVSRIEASQRATAQMDTTATIVNVASLYAPSAEHPALHGEGVVVGLMDVGFDLTHPNFIDAETGRPRISVLWDQLSSDTIGSNLPVGRDYLGAEVVMAQQHTTDGLTQAHGTHTLGIAAGNGHDTPYKGIATASDLCLVSNAIAEDAIYIDETDYYKYTTATDALGFKYIFDYAQQQGKPCVASFSEGFVPCLEEEDSLYSAVLDKLTGEGRIIVTSAGNENQEQTYMDKQAEETEAGAFIRSFRQTAFYRVKADGPVALRLYAYRGEAGAPTDTLTLQSPDMPADSIITLPFAIGSDTISVTAVRYPSPFLTQREEVWQFLIESGQARISELPHIALSLMGDCHAEAYGSSTSAFTTRATDTRWRAAQKGHNILAPGCFPSVICVGATSHRLRMDNIDGQAIAAVIGDKTGVIWPCSSTGPSMNGAMKPDIVAPGTFVVSSWSSFSDERSSLVASSDYNGRTYPWVALTGTSMSAPIVAGIIALWLQVCPTLTPDDIREVFASSARHPDTAIDYPNNIYGYGEIDASEGLHDIIEKTTGIRDIGIRAQEPLRLIKERGKLRLLFGRDVKGSVAVSVYAPSGVCVVSLQAEVADGEMEMAVAQHLKGLYVVKIQTADGQQTSQKVSF